MAASIDVEYLCYRVQGPIRDDFGDVEAKKYEG